MKGSIVRCKHCGWREMIHRPKDEPPIIEPLPKVFIEPYGKYKFPLKDCPGFEPEVEEK